MARLPRVGDLEIDQDLDFERRSWTAQRIAWVLTALVLLAALAGLCGPGPLSETTAGEGGPISLEYSRFERRHAPNSMLIHLGSGSTRDGKAQVWMDREFMENIEVHRISPEPERVELQPDRLVYEFPVPDASRPTAVSLFYEAERLGVRSGRIGLVGGQPVSFTQLVFP